jgi:hypothetical protein
MTAPVRTVSFLIRLAVADGPRYASRVDNENDFH